MYVHLKQSGELLSSKGSSMGFCTPQGLRASTEKIVSVHRTREKLCVNGIMMISGAGNVVRGNDLRDHGIAEGVEDVLGRTATILNTLVLASELEKRNVPTRVFIADTMKFSDQSLPGGSLDPYDPQAVKQAYEAERVVLVAGGTGEDNKTTDNAVLEYARRHRQLIGDNDPLLVLKGTKFDGVFDGDPAVNARARRYGRISAGYMIDRYKDFTVVDEASLHTINWSEISLRVYADGVHDLTTVLQNGGDGVGTLIVPGYSAPEYACVD